MTQLQWYQNNPYCCLCWRMSGMQWCNVNQLQNFFVNIVKVLLANILTKSCFNIQFKHKLNNLQNLVSYLNYVCWWEVCFFLLLVASDFFKFSFQGDAPCQPLTSITIVSSLSPSIKILPWTSSYHTSFVSFKFNFYLDFKFESAFKISLNFKQGLVSSSRGLMSYTNVMPWGGIKNIMEELQNSTIIMTSNKTEGVEDQILRYPIIQLIERKTLLHTNDLGPVKNCHKKDKAMNPLTHRKLSSNISSWFPRPENKF